MPFLHPPEPVPLDKKGKEALAVKREKDIQQRLSASGAGDCSAPQQLETMAEQRMKSLYSTKGWSSVASSQTPLIINKMPGRSNDFEKSFISFYDSNFNFTTNATPEAVRFEPTANWATAKGTTLDLATKRFAHGAGLFAGAQGWPLPVLLRHWLGHDHDS